MALSVAGLALACCRPAEATVAFSTVKEPSGTVTLNTVRWHPTLPIALLAGSGGSAGNARVYIYTDVDAPTLPGTLVAKLTAPNKSYQDLEWSADGQFALMVGTAGTVVRYDRVSDTFTDLSSTSFNADFYEIRPNPFDSNFSFTANWKTGTATNSPYMPRLFQSNGYRVWGPIAGTAYYVSTGSSTYTPYGFSWRPDGDYAIITNASYSTSPAVLVYDPNQDTFPLQSSNAMANPSVQTGGGNYIDVAFRPTGFPNGPSTDYFALLIASTSLWRVDDAGNGTTNGGLSVSRVTGMSGHFMAGVNWASTGSAAVAYGGNLCPLHRIDSQGQSATQYTMPYPNAISRADWRPGTNYGLLVGNASVVTKFWDTQATNLTPTVTPTPTRTFTPSPTVPTATPTDTLTPTSSPTPTATYSGTPPTLTPTPTPTETSPQTPTPTVTVTPVPTDGRCCASFQLLHNGPESVRISVRGCDTSSTDHFFFAKQATPTSGGTLDAGVCFLPIGQLPVNPPIGRFADWVAYTYFWRVTPTNLSGPAVPFRIELTGLSTSALGPALPLHKLDTVGVYTAGGWQLFPATVTDHGSFFDVSMVGTILVGNAPLMFVLANRCEAFLDCPTVTPATPATGTPTYTPTPTPPTSGPSPTPTPTGDFTWTPTATPTDQPTLSPTPTPPWCPGIWLAGMWDTRVSGGQFGYLRIIAFPDPTIPVPLGSRLMIMDGGTPTALGLTDDGLMGDFDAGDGIYGYQIPLDWPRVPGKLGILLELGVVTPNSASPCGPKWPYLTVDE